MNDQSVLGDSLRNSLTGSGHSNVRGKPEKSRVGRKTYDALMGILAEEPETSTSPIGVYVANSTKRKLKKQMEELILP